MSKATKTYNGKPVYPFKVGDNNTGQCSSCGEVFYGERSFDTHRRDGACLDPGDALNRKGEPHPYWLDKSGRWHYGPRRADFNYATLQGCETDAPGVITLPTDSKPSETGSSNAA